MGYLVTAPLVIVRDDEGKMHHVYQGAPLPDNALPEDVERFLDEGFVSEAPEAEPEQSEPPEPPEPKAPSKAASKADWVAYAVEHKGLSQADAEAFTRDELASSFGEA